MGKVIHKYIKILLKPIKKYGLVTVLVFSLLLSPSSYLILAQEATQSAETESTRQSGETAPSVVPTPTDPPAGGLTLPPTPTPTSTLSPTSTPKVETTPIAAPSATLKPASSKPSLDKVKLLKESFEAIEDAEVNLGGLKLGDIKPILIGPDGERLEVEVEEEIVDSETILKIKRPRSFVPGKYTLTVEDVNGQTVTQDFTLGVLAINTNKSIYLPNETAKLAMAVLDDRGKMVCDAKLTLKIEKSTSDGGRMDSSEVENREVVQLSTEDNSITVNPECKLHDFTLKPDYEAEYQVSETGTYKMTLTAETENGTYTITDSFEVRDFVPFDVERISATRIYPPKEYPVTFKIKVNEDFKGEVIESLPGSFEIRNPKSEAPNKFKIRNSNDQNEKLIIWQVDWQKGNALELSFLPEESLGRKSVSLAEPTFSAAPTVTPGTEKSNLEKLDATPSALLATDSAKLSTQAAELVKSLEDQVRDISEHLATISAEREEVKEESAEIGKKVKEIVGETQLSVSEEKEVIKNSEVMPGVDIQYQAGEEELRESIILKSQEELKDLFSEDSQLKLNFNLKLKDLVPHRDEEGDWRFRAKENNSDVFTFLKPIFKDAAGATISAELNLANPQGAKLDSTEFAVTLVASRKWLESKDRVYPITIEHPIRANRENIDYDPKTTLQRPLPIDTSIKKTLGEEEYSPAEDYDWQVKLPASFGGGYYLFGQKNKEGGVKVIGPEGWSLSFRQKESQAKDFNLVGNQIKWQSSPGIISRYTSLSDRLKADYLVEKREVLSGSNHNQLNFTVKFNDEPKDEADELTIFKGKGYLRPEQNSDGTISFVAENDGEIFKLPLPEITDAKGQKTIGSFTFQKIGQGIATLSINIPDKFLDSAIFPLTIDPTVLNSATDIYSLLYPGGKHIVQTANGKLVACYVKDPTNDYPACRVSSDNGVTWGTEQVITSYDAMDLAIGADQTDGNVFYLVFVDYQGIKAVFQGDVLFYKGALSGTDITFSGPLTLDGSTKASKVTLTVDTQNNRPAVAWSIEKRNNPSPKSLVRFLRCKTGDCLTDSHWTNAAGTSDCTGNLPTAYLTDTCNDAMAATTATSVFYGMAIDQMPGSGTFADPTSVKWDDNGSFSTLTNAFDNNTGTTSSINSLSATQDYLYVGYSSTFGKVHLDITDTNSNAATLNAQYYNGAWTSLGSVRDGTESPSGTAFGTDGAVGVGVSDTGTGIPSDWTTTTVDSVSAYWVRFRPSADFDASVSLAEVDMATTYAKDLFLWWIHSVDRDLYYNSAAWDGTDDWNWLETTVEDADVSDNTNVYAGIASGRDETNSKLIFGYQAETGTNDDFEVYERNTSNTKTARTTAGGLGSSNLNNIASFAEDSGNVYAIYFGQSNPLNLEKNSGGTSWNTIVLDAGTDNNHIQMAYKSANNKLDMLYRTGSDPYAVEYHTWHLTETRTVSAETSLPTDDSISLTGANDYFFDEDDYVDTNTPDNNYDSWDQSANTGRGTSGVGVTDYVVYYFKDTNANNTDNITPAWEGKFSQACSETYPAKLEIYCRSASCSGGAGWKEVASSTICTADTDFTLSGTISTNVSYYYGTDDWIGSNTVALRVYKQSNGAAVSAYTDYFSQNAALFTAPSGVDISGTCDQYDQTTDCVDDGTEEIKVAVNDTLQAQVDTDFTGSWSITGVTVNSGDTVTVFINSATSQDQAVAVTEYDGSGAITGMKLFERHLTIGSDDTGVSITNTELDKYTRASHGDDDVFHEVTTGTLTVDANGIFTDEELFILTGSTFAPAGDVNTHDIELETTAGVFTLGSNTIKVSGSWDNNGDFNADTGTVTFTATLGTETVDSTGASDYDFNTLNFGETSGTATWQLNSALDVGGALTIAYGTMDQETSDPTVNVDGALTINANGTLTASSTGSFTVQGNWTNDGILNEGTGTITLDGAISANLDSGCADADACTNENFYSLTIYKTDAAEGNDNVTLTSTNLRATNTITITDGELVQGALNVRAEGTTGTAVSVAAAGEWYNISTGDLKLGGTFDNAGTVTFNANGTTCGDNDDIQIRSTAAAQRTWSEAGTFSIQDVDVQYQAGTATIYAYSSTNSGNNGANWIFEACPVKIEQQINIVDKAVTSGGSSNGIVCLDPSKYNGETFYFEVVAKVDSGTGAADLTYDAGPCGSAPSGGSTVSISNISTTSYTRYRSLSFTPTGNGNNAYISNLAGTGISVKAARVIIVQKNSSITDAEGQVEVGNNETSTNTSYTELTDKKIFRYTQASFNPTPTVYFEATVRATTIAGGSTNQGPNNPSNGAEDTTVGTKSWTGYTNVYTNDDSNYATVALNKNEVSYYIKATNFVFSLVNCSSIDGILVEVDRRSSDANFMKDNSVRLINNLGTIVGDDKADSTIYWPTSDTYKSYGGSTDSWNAGLGCSDIDGSANFGIGFSAANLKSGGPATGTAYVDHIRVTVYYTQTGTTGTAYAALYTSAGIYVTNSEVSTTSTSWVLLRSASPISLSDGTDYVVRVKTSDSAATAYIANAKIVLDQTSASGISATEIYHQYVNTKVSEAGASYVAQNFVNFYDDDNFEQGTFNIFFEATLKNNGGTSNARLTPGAIGNVQGAASYTISRTATVITLTDDTSYDTEITNADVSTSWIIIKTTGLGGGVNNAPNSPTSLAQKKTDDTVLATGGWTNETSVKFTASASDPDSSDTLYLCVEKDILGTGFSNTEDACGTGVAYSGTPVEVTVTILSLTDNSEYHWQARIKDAVAAYSSWVSYDVNLETERDFGIDTTDPTGGTVYDGTETGVDKDFNDSSLSSLSANWSGFDASVSGLSSYEYSIGTSQGGIDVKVWTDNGTVTSVTASILTLQTSQVYYFNVRAIDNAGGTQSPVISSDGQIITPSLSFSLSPTTISFVNLNEGNSYNDSKTSTLTTSTNAYGGYVVRAFATDYLRSADSSFTIINFNGGTYASPDEWLTGDRGFGYNSSDATIQGVNKFNSTPCPGGGNPPCYASFSQTAPGDILADHTDNVTGSPITGEQFTMTYQVKTNNIQAASTYVTTVVYTITAIY